MNTLLNIFDFKTIEGLGLQFFMVPIAKNTKGFYEIFVG
jgi:hypothetical protein